MNKIWILVLALFLFGCKNKEIKNDENEPIIYLGEAYGSTFRIIYYGYGENLNKEIKQIMDEFDASVNTYIEDSYLSKFNKSEFGAEADEMLIEMTQLSTNYNTTSNGFFEPTVSGLSDLWGFSKNGIKHTPTPQQVDSVLQLVGLKNIRIHEDSLSKNDPRITLNFNAMTGYVNDKISEFFLENKIENYLIEIGGEILAKGKKPDGTLWTVGIDKPVENQENREIYQVVELKNQAMATSGNYRKFFIDETTGQKIVHTLNPKTGKPEVSNLLSATVIAETCAEADAMATAVMAMGLEKAKEFAQQRGDLKFFLIWMDENENLQNQSFHNFPIKAAENQ